MKSLLIILGLAFSSGNTPSVQKANSNNNRSESTVKALEMQDYYVVNRKVNVPPRNTAEADQIADVSGPYGNIAYLGSSLCRSWWLNKPVVPGGVTWSYYYSSGATITTSATYFLLYCPY